MDYRIELHPMAELELWEVIEVVAGFPYIIVFEVQEDIILVLTIFHTSRDPENWEHR